MKKKTLYKGGPPESDDDGSENVGKNQVATED